MQYEVDNLGIAHLAGLQHSAFEGRVVVAADDIVATQLLGIEFDEFPLKERLFAKQIASVLITHIMGTVGEQEQFVVKIGFIHPEILPESF